MVYLMSGFRGSNLLAIKLGREGDLTGTDAIAWSHNRGTPYVPSPLLYDNRLYFFSGNEARLSCFDVKTGKALFETQRVEDLQGVYASPLGAAGRVYLVGRNGTTVVIRHADKVEPLATNVLDDRIDASPAAVGKELFLRGHQYLYCIAQ
jgi:outer membrane protein assembly factor BamB